MELPSAYTRTLVYLDMFGIPTELLGRISSKNSLSLLASSYEDLQRFCPKSFCWKSSNQSDEDSKSQFSDFLEELKKQEELSLGETKALWMLKRDGCSRGFGVSVITNKTNIQSLQLPRVFQRAHVAQKYLENPCLIPSALYPGNGYKFDLRIYVLCMYNRNDLSKLHVFLYKNGFARRCEVLYDQSQSEVDLKKLYLTNSAINASAGIRQVKQIVQVSAENNVFEFDSEFYSSGDETSDNEIDLQMREPFGNTLTIEQAFQILEESGSYSRAQITHCKDEIKNLVSTLFQTVHDSVQRLPNQEKLKGRLVHEKSITLLGVDVILNDKLSPFLLEVNRYPDFKVYSPDQWTIKQEIIRDIMKLSFPSCDPLSILEMKDLSEIDAAIAELNPEFSESCNSEVFDNYHNTGCWEAMTFKK